MKKIIFILTFIMLFTACGYLSSSSQLQTPFQSGSENAATVEMVNLVNNNFLNPEIAVYNENGAYVPSYNVDGSYTICYIDFSTKQMVALCSNLSCQHNNENCNAYIKPNVGGVDLELTDDKLIVFVKGNTINVPPSIITMELSGENAVVLGEFSAGERIKPPYVHGDDTVYFILERAEKDENGKVNLQNYLVCTDLLDGDVREINQVTDTTFIRGVSDNKLLMKNIENGVHKVYLTDTNSGETTEIYSYKQGEELEFEAGGEIYTIDYNQKTIKKITDGKTVTVNSFDFEGGTSKTYFRIIDDDKIIVDNTVFSTQINDTVTSRYCIPLYDAPVTEITMEYTYDERTRPISVLGITSQYAFGIVGYEKGKASGTDQAGNIFEYETTIPLYGLFDKDDYFNNINNYELINQIY